MSVTVNVAVARPSQPLRASCVDAASQSVPLTATAKIPGWEKAKQVEQYEYYDAEAKCQRCRIHDRRANRHT